MYQSYYNLKIKPFQITTDPKFLWLGEKHKEALATLKYGILENKGFLLLTGDVGTGKTVLIHGLMKLIDVSAIVAAVPDPGLSTLDFFNFLSEEFKMNRRFDSKGAFLIHLKHFLYKASAADKKVLLIIDEAQRLNHELIEQIRLLSNIEMDNRKLINIFFVGQSEFNKIINDERNKAVKQRITVSHHIDPLTESESREYIKHRLKIAGATRELFKADALRNIYTFSHGYPRLINIICDHALLTGYSAGKKVIDSAVIKECEKELRIPIDDAGKENDARESVEQQESLMAGFQNQSARKRIGYLAVIVLLLLVAGYFLFSFQVTDTPRWKIEEIAPQAYDSPTLKAKESYVPGVADKKEENIDLPAVKPADESVIPDTNAPQSDAAEITSQTEQLAKVPEVTPFPDRKIVIYFNHNSNDLPEKAYETLDRIADFMVQNPQTTISINGYTDASGAYSYNMSISKFRANMVKGYLVGKGVDAIKIKAAGLGPKDPIASNATEEGRRQNRRVEVELNLDKP
ncbi:MAG: OmpA family protein [Desulfobacterales bacterium]|jgi:general secretion pathway protein A